MSNGIFDVENRFWVFLRRMTDVFLLSMLQLLFSIPIITAGAAASGFYAGAMKINKDEESGVWIDFISGFKSSFKVSTCCWLCQLVITAIAVLNIYICWLMDSKTGLAFMGFNIFVVVFVFFVSFYLYTISAKYKFSFRKVVHDSVVTAVVRLPISFSLLLLVVSMAFFSFKIKYLYILAPFITEYQIARASNWIFGKQEAAEETVEEIGEGEPEEELP